MTFTYPNGDTAAFAEQVLALSESSVIRFYRSELEQFQKMARLWLLLPEIRECIEQLNIEREVDFGTVSPDKLLTKLSDEALEGKTVREMTAYSAET